MHGYPFICLASLILLISCGKHPQPEVAIHGADSLAQNVYSVSRSSLAQKGGVILLTPFNPKSPLDSGRLMVMDGDGHLIKQKTTPPRSSNFQRWVINGLVRYTWFVADRSLNSPTNGGYVVIADEELRELNRVGMLAHAGFQDVSQGMDSHDFLLLGENHYIALAYFRRTVSNVPASAGTGGAGFVDVNVLQEVKNGQVVWQWESNDYPEFYTTSIEGNSYSNMSKAQDYMHINAMVVDEADGNLLVSMRNCDQVIKVSRTTGDVMWRLGGVNSDFPMTPDMLFLRQHHLTFADDGHTLLLLDNGDITLRPYSRVLEFQLNEATHMISGYRAYRINEPFIQFTGSVQKMGDRYFIGGGTGNYVLEVNYITGQKVLELKADVLTYRALKY